ncbi:MAG: DNA polymerase III subunit delta [Acidobacteria bacterium]|nr:DNA polymerase III subunit delta [Acidobacteriota bacterium]
MALSREQLRAQLRQRKIAPVYVLFGAETYLRDAAARYIADLCFSEGDLREFNEDEYSLNTPENLRSALAAAEQLPMMAAKRVIRVTEVHVAASSNRDTLKEEFEEALAAYLANPCQSTVLIILADELNGNRKLTKLLINKALAVEFKPLDGGALQKWVTDRFRELGAEADAATVRHLVDTVGNDVRRLNNEVAKLSAAALPDGRVTLDLIDALVPNSRELSNFSVTDELVAGRKDKALRDLKKILDDGMEPLGLLGLIGTTYRRLLMVNEMLRRGDAKGASSLPFGKDAFLASARRIEQKKLVHAIRRISETDLAIKTSIAGSGTAGARMQIEMLVCELALLKSGPD